MKERELREHAVCDYCKQKIGESMVPAFFTLEVKSYVIDMRATQRQQGLGLMIGGLLAMHMGADEDLARETSSVKTTVCWNCHDTVIPKTSDEQAA